MISEKRGLYGSHHVVDRFSASASEYDGAQITIQQKSLLTDAAIAFEALGNEGWNWQEFLKYMKKVRRPPLVTRISAI
jgi:hypothetical protein